VDIFRTGWNHPWIAYGHDFGRAWGHDGLSTSGWTCETEPTTRGFTDSRVVVDPETGRGALCIDADLRGGDSQRSRGAVYLSLADHWPIPCPRPAGPLALDLDGVLARCRIRLPGGAAGTASAPNWLQVFLKTRLSDDRWPTLYMQPTSISPSWEGRHVDIVVPLGGRNAAHVDPGFDIGSVSLIGLTMGVGSAAMNGAVSLDEVVLETLPPTVFDFEQPELGAQLAGVLRRTGRAWSLVRFFVFCDGRAAPTFASDGRVLGLDDVFYRDFDVLVETAAQQGLSLMPVLLDFGWCAYPRTVSGVQLGGHADIIRDVGKRQSFLERALEPLLQRYSRHPAIYAWDVCNEPEWIIDDVPEAFRRDHDVVSLAEMRAFVRSCAAYVHRFAPTHLVTLGSARRKWLTQWTGCDLDLYQFHWYDHFRDEEPFPWGPYEELGLDKPCLVGEVPTTNTRFTRGQFMRAAEEGGYSGLLFWSYGARDAFSSLCPARDARPGCGAGYPAIAGAPECDGHDSQGPWRNPGL
jgi:hypothetical protein